MNEWYVEVRRYEDEGLERKFGPYGSKRRADRADRGANQQLNHDKFFTVVVEVGNLPEAS